MRLLNVNGRLVNKNVQKHRIKWDDKSASKVQFRAKQFFKEYWKSHVVYEEFPVYGTRLRVDLINFTKKIAIEVHGQQHFKFNKFFHSNSRIKFFQSMKRDWEKTEWLELNDIKLVELEEKDVDQLSIDFLEDKFNVFIV
tara:strand:- start:12806 stop:13225 length:420 start_codon:yes stop_codon:yes gene_type:complete